jgi:hypothetical protein
LTVAVHVPIGALATTLAGHVTVGFVVSLTVIVKLHDVPPSEHVTVVVPTGKRSPDATGVPF